MVRISLVENDHIWIAAMECSPEWHQVTKI